MKFSENWLRTVCPTELNTSELNNALTMAGLEVETVESVSEKIEGVVVGEVVSVREHPNADKLRICEVNVGHQPNLSIVCGAPNVRAGIKVPAALAGASLPGGLKIKKSKLRGEMSEGMLCSSRELSLSDDHDGLLVLPDSLQNGGEIKDALDLNDNVFTLKLTANRGDCLSIMGISRELQAITGTPFTSPLVRQDEDIAAGDRKTTITATDACSVYFGLTIRGVNPNAETPREIVNRLERSGVRAISAIVDLTNYVMLELGQPMHAFDEDKLQGNIDVRLGRSGERLSLLNGQKLSIDPTMLVIADEAGPVALAGIMGGEDSAVDEGTKNVFLESAVFSEAAVAGKWRRLGFTTDALHRFERGVDPAGSERALFRLAELITEVCGGTQVFLTKSGSSEVKRRAIKFRPDRVHKLIGIDISVERIREILERLDMNVESSGNLLMVTPPTYRFDLELEEDLVEEIVRIEGFDKLPTTLPESVSGIIDMKEYPSWVDWCREHLVKHGYQEVITYSFISESIERDFCDVADSIKLINPIAEQYTTMRSSLIGSLCTVLRKNRNHKNDRLRIFETSLCFERNASEEIVQSHRVAGLITGTNKPEQWSVKARNNDFYDIKGDLEAMFPMCKFSFATIVKRAFHPGKAASVWVEGKNIGFLGEIHPKLTDKYDLGKNVYAFEIDLDSMPPSALPTYTEFSKYPSVRRDIAFEVPASGQVEMMISSVLDENISYLIDMQLFDVYTGKGVENGLKSLAFGLIFQDKQKTLKDEEVENSVKLVLKLLQQKFNAKLRGNEVQG